MLTSAHGLTTTSSAPSSAARDAGGPAAGVEGVSGVPASGFAPGARVGARLGARVGARLGATLRVAAVVTAGGTRGCRASMAGRVDAASTRRGMRLTASAPGRGEAGAGEG